MRGVGARATAAVAPVVLLVGLRDMGVLSYDPRVLREVEEVMKHLRRWKIWKDEREEAGEI